MSYNLTSKQALNDPGIVWPETRRGQMIEAEINESTIIDRAVLEMLAALPRGADILTRVQEFEKVMVGKMAALRLAVNERNRHAVEDLAGEISRQALTVGAVRVLRLSYELQSLARCGAYDDASRTNDELEIAFTQAQESLRQAI